MKAVVRIRSAMMLTFGLLAACSADPQPSAEADGGPSDGNQPPVKPPAGMWVRSYEGVGDEGVAAISARTDGSVVVLGRYEGPATFNPGQPDEMLLALPDGESEYALIHYQSDGSLRSLQADPLGTGSGGVHVADDGSFYLTGTGGFMAGSVMVPDEADAFVAKYDADGTPLWAGSASGEAGTGAASQAAVAQDGSVVIGGTFEGTITFGVGEPTETRLAADPISEEIFLARYDNDGALLWAKRGISAPYLPDWNLAPAEDGGVVIYGTLENTTTFNPDLADETKLDGGNIGFVAKLDAAGEVRWAKAFDQAEGINNVSGLATYPDGSVVVTGSFQRMLTFGLDTTLAAVGSDFPGRTQFPDFFAARFDADGELVWARQEGGEVWDGGNEVFALEDGSTLVTGSYTNDVTFAAGEPAETTLSTDTNQMTPFVAVINRNGTLRWAREGVEGQAVPLADGLAIAGTFMGTRTLFAGEPGETTLASAGRWDAYVARFGWELTR